VALGIEQPQTRTPLSKLKISQAISEFQAAHKSSNGPKQKQKSPGNNAKALKSNFTCGLNSPINSTD
jgi:hypothetical protein